MWAPALLGRPGEDTELASPKLIEDGTVCFNFWFDMKVKHCPSLECLIEPVPSMQVVLMTLLSMWRAAGT
jgi:hypothetical protein